MNVKKWIMLAVISAPLLFVLSGCKKKENPFPDHIGGKIFQGLKTINVKCAGCHGTLGEGGMRAPSLTKGVNNITTEQFVAIVRDGRGGMPAFGSMLKEEEIRQIVDWIKKLSNS